MSLHKETVLDETIKLLFKKSWLLANATVQLCTEGAKTGLLKKVKKLAEEINEICEEELP